MDNQTQSGVKEKNYSLGAGIIIDEWGKPMNLSVMNNIICNNYSSGCGGGISVENADVELINNTLYNNRGYMDANSLYIRDFNYKSTVILMNSILWSNYRAEAEVSTGFNNTLYTFHNDIRGGHDPHWDIDTEPKFYYKTYNLRYGDFCIGRGTDSVEVDGSWYRAPETDIYGKPRKSNGGIDLGALETPFTMNERFAFTDTSSSGWGDCDYIFDFKFEGGMPPYTFYLDEDEMDNIPFEGVCKGAHTIKVEDAEGKVLTWVTKIGVGTDKESEDLKGLLIYPNPAKETLRLKFSVNESPTLRISLYTLTGQHKKQFSIPNPIAGEQEIELNISGIEPGLYFLRLEGHKTETLKLIIR